jgi:antitoxin MazE
MELSIRNIGNSKGLLLPKPLLLQAGLDQASVAIVSIEDGAIVLRKPASPARAGWGEAAAQVAAANNDTLLMGEFDNAADSDWVW